MLEILVEEKNKEEKIALVENGNLIEYYEEDKESNRREGNIYVGTVKDIIVGMQSAFIDIGTEKNSFIHVKDVVPQVDEKTEEKDENLKIKDVVKTNQKLLVQVQKDSNDKKGARTTTHIKLTGKYIILMPNTNIITISQKIIEQKEKDRLLEIIKNNFDFSVSNIISELDLRRPIYEETSCYGHFGNPKFPWEKIKKLKW